MKWVEYMRIEVSPKMYEKMPDMRRIAADSNVLPPGFISLEHINSITHDITLWATLCRDIDIKKKNALNRYNGFIRTEKMPF